MSDPVERSDVRPSADQVLRELLACDPEAALAHVLGSLGRGGLVGPLLDASQVAILLEGRHLDRSQLRRAVLEGFLTLRFGDHVVDAVAARADLDDDVAVRVLDELTAKSSPPQTFSTDRVWGAFAKARHPAAAAWLLAACEAHPGDVPRPPRRRGPARDGHVGTVDDWLVRLRETSAVAAAANVVVCLGPTWTGSAEELFAVAAAVADSA